MGRIRISLFSQVPDDLPEGLCDFLTIAAVNVARGLRELHALLRQVVVDAVGYAVKRTRVPRRNSGVDGGSGIVECFQAVEMKVECAQRFHECVQNLPAVTFALVQNEAAGVDGRSSDVDQEVQAVPSLVGASVPRRFRHDLRDHFDLVQVD